MCRTSSLIIIGLALVILLVAANAEAENHNAVIISGEKAFAPGPPPEGPRCFADPENYLCFWTDIFLMWEALYFTGKYELHGIAPGSDHIYIFYGPDGRDCKDDNLNPYRYSALRVHEIENISDYGYYKDDILAILDSLAYTMNSTNNFFFYVISHGKTDTLTLRHGAEKISAIELAEKTDQITCKTKTFWFQPCHSGSFIDELEDTNTVILTATSADRRAYWADDIVKWDTAWVEELWESYVVDYSEKEQYIPPGPPGKGGEYQTHGEFSFHAMNAATGETPKGETRNADENGDLLVSMNEIYDHIIEWDSWQYHGRPEQGHLPELPQYSDSGGIGESLFLGWDDYTPPSTPAALVDSCTCTDTTMYVILNWNDNTEQDLVGYRVYRNDDRIASLHESRHSDYDVEEMVYRYDVSAFDVANNESQLHRVRLSLICGDPKPDGVISVSDANYLVSFIYRGGPEPACPPAPYSCCGDVNVDGRITIADATYIIDYIYRGGPPPCEPEGRSSSGEYAQAGLSRLTTDEDVAEITVLAQFDVPIAGVHLGITYDAETIDMLDPAVTSRSEGLELFYDLNLTRGYLSLGMLDLKGQNYIERGDGAILTLRLRGERGSPDLKSVCLEEVVFVDMDSRTLQTEILNGCGPSGGSQGASLSGGTSMRFVLAQNSPNPFSSGTSIEYVIPTSSHVVLTVYDISGKAVETLVDGTQTSGFHSVQWDGRDGIGGRVAAGVYFYKLTADEFTSVKKMVLLR